MNNENLVYVGFWPRVGAAIVDTILLVLVTFPILHLIYGASYWSNPALIVGPADFIVSWVFPAIAVIVFWVYKQATPGKMAVGAKIIDADSGAPVSTGKLIIRYLAYYISMIPLFLGIIWVAFDSRKQGWHDKIANTVVVRAKNHSSIEAEFNEP